MRELLDSFLENGLADFEGLQISGTIPVKTDLINAIIADFLKPEPAAAPEFAPAESTPVADAPAAPPSTKKKISLQNVVKPLIKHVGVRAIDGKIVVEFDVRR